MILMILVKLAGADEPHAGIATCPLTWWQKKKGTWAGGIATILERTGMGMGKLSGVGIVGASIVGAGIEGAGWGDSHQRQELVVSIAGADERLALGVGIAGADGPYAGIATCPFTWWQKRHMGAYCGVFFFVLCYYH